MPKVGSTTRIRKNLMIGGRRVTFSLEAVVWDTLTEICRRESLSLDELCEIAIRETGNISMASALRILSLRYFRSLAVSIENGERFESQLSSWVKESARAAA